MDLISEIHLLLYLLPALIIAAALHELAHGLVANHLGDPTAKNLGRLTLNPIKHLDPMGSAMFLLTYFLTAPLVIGWAKPIPVGMQNLKNPRVGMAWVALAGPATNILLAIIGLLIAQSLGDSALDNGVVFQLLYFFIQINVVLAIFNLMPIPPLDGSRIVGLIMNDETYSKWAKADQYGIFILLFLLLFAREPFFLLITEAMGFVFTMLGFIPGIAGGEWITFFQDIFGG